MVLLRELGYRFETVSKYTVLAESLMKVSAGVPTLDGWLGSPSAETAQMAVRPSCLA